MAAAAAEEDRKKLMYNSESVSSSHLSNSSTQIANSLEDIEEDDFMAELTRQMAHHMLEEDDHGGKTTGLHMTINTAAAAAASNQLRPPPPMIRPQPAQTKKSYGRRGERVDSGSAMSCCWVLFLGGKGRMHESSAAGTGVFFPRVKPTDPYHHHHRHHARPDKRSATRRRPSTSTVLIPARVMQVLQLHYNKNHVVDHTYNKTTILMSHNYTSDADNINADLPPQHKKKDLIRTTNYDHDQLYNYNSGMKEPPYQDFGLPQEWPY